MFIVIFKLHLHFMVDFFENKVSSTLPDCSYKPGIVAASLKNVLPIEIHSRLQKAFKEFDKSMKGYFTNEAVVVGVESRTSSPVRIPRDNETLEHPQIKGLFPCGEGAGYAGGIVSAAVVRRIGASFHPPPPSACCCRCSC